MFGFQRNKSVLVFLLGIDFRFVDTKIEWMSMVNNGAFALLFGYGKYEAMGKETITCLAILRTQHG